MSGAMPAVSVLLPVRDAASFLPQCLASLERQTLSGFEVVVVDDGSTDGSTELLDRWAAAGPDRRVLHGPPAGLVAALNRGLESCRGDLVARIDADDIAHPRRLELQAELLAARPEVDIASCRVQSFPRRRVGEGFRVYEAWLNSLDDHESILRERFVESPLAHPSVMVRRQLLVAAGGYRDRGWPEDYDLWLRLLEAGARVAKRTETLCFWREHAVRLTRTDPRYAIDRFLACKAHFLARGPLADGRGAVIWGAGRTGRRLVTHLVNEGVVIHAFIDIDPAKIGRVVRDRPVVGPEQLPSMLQSRPLVLAAVASRGARELIRSRLLGMGLAEGDDFSCVA